MKTTTRNNLFKAIWQIPAMVVLAAVFGFPFNFARTDGIALIGDWSLEARMTTVTGERLDISLPEAEKLFRSGAAVFLDARSANDYARGHIHGARSLPWQDVDKFFMEVAESLEPETPIIIYCDGETCSLSHDLAVFLKDMGFTDVRVLVNGWTVWQAAGLPVETSEIQTAKG
jgi:rhodanese-related sulfurtransferase